MTRQEQIEDFQHFLDTHEEEVKAHICQPPYDFVDDDWEEVPPKSAPINGVNTLFLETFPQRKETT